ncbi:MAG: UDP-N-acetylmuramoyl-L-alanine--D-glutamate ligase [Acidimicrobiales bacterium]|nr:UDP-N-acetylmuramoyl-L-alanine--D-glutamate ligase [Acidimicrobiales bacterium]
MTIDLRARLAAPVRALVVGMGVTNRAVVGALLRRGHAVTAVDDRPDDALREAARDLGVDLVESPTDADLAALAVGVDFVVPAPGLPETHPAFSLGPPAVSELDLAAVWDDRPVVAITGTNGKTTVVELCVAALQRAGRRAIAAGNTDVPLVSAIDQPGIDAFVVEASSFRLARVIEFAPDVATWLNFAPDHLDVHLDLETYEQAKARVFSSIRPGGTAVANALDPVVMRHVPANRTVVTFGSPGADWHLDGEKLTGPDGAFTTVDRLWRALPHDIEDVLAVAATLAPLGVAPEAVAAAAASFPGLPHRVAPVGEIDGSTYYDDSKSTTPHATLAALRGFDSVVLIAGGRNKGIDLAELADGRDHIHAVVAIGDAAAEVAAAFSGVRPVEIATDMDRAVATARLLAAGGHPVLLSPACASFDWYRNYAERGDDFIRAVTEMDA